MTVDLHNRDDVAAADRAGLLPAAAAAGAQVRSVADQLAGLPRLDRPRAFVVVGARAPDAVKVLAALVGSGSPAPIVASPELPGWVGPLDVVVVLAARQDDEEAARAAEIARHRGAAVVVRGAAIGPVATAAATDLLIPGVAVPEALAAPGRYSLVVGVAAACGLLPAPDLAAGADLLDAVCLACHPGAESFVNPAIGLAEHLAGGTPLLVAADPAADAVATHAAGVLSEIAGVATACLDSGDAVAGPALLSRIGGPRNIFADPDLDPDEPAQDVRAVLITAPELSRFELAAATARSLRSALPSAIADTADDLVRVALPGRERSAPSGDPANPSAVPPDRPDPLACILGMTTRWDFAAVYLGLTIGQIAPQDSPDGLARRGTARTGFRPAITDPGPARDPDDWS